ncbi:MAG TPA: AMP-binding protein [Myxococcota bacterium]|nr:AMP-binding protein [Myxococcota bacterium]
MAEVLAPYAERHGDAPALIDEHGTTSWRDLDARVDRAVHALRAAGLRSGDTIALLMGNRRELFELMAACAHGSWRYVPVNWHWAPEEIAYVLQNSDAVGLVADARFAELARAAVARDDCPALRAQVMVAAEAPGFADYERLLAAAPSGPAGDTGLGGPMFYTSGTTGRPKGVKSTLFKVGAPAALIKFVSGAITGTLSLPADGTALLVGPAYHSAQWAFSFLPMLAGQSVVMRHRFDPAETLALIDRHGVTNLHLVPTQFVRLLRLDDAERARFDGTSLRVAWHGAAPCPPDVKRRMIEWWGPKISEYYGSTEGAIVTRIAAEEWLARPGSVGRPTEAIELRIVRDDGSPAEIGEEGQIYFRNRMGTDFEYHKDPEKTKAAHLEPGVFTTGDVGYVDVEGYLFLCDRKIDMIISGGVNIYPAEIEGVLCDHPAVLDAAVFGIPDEEFGESVKAAVQVAPGHAAGAELEERLVTYCRERLAGYKAPRSVDFVESLPRHPTGKLYKRLLRDPYWKGTGRRI